MMRKYNKEKYVDEYQIPKNTEEYQKNKFDKISNILFYIIMLEIGFFIGLIIGGIIK
jgi:hypothetical protein